MEAGFHPDDIQTLEDFRGLPIIMTKEKERESQEESIKKYGHPFGMHLCSRLEDIELTSITSGTTGTPTFTYTFSKRDLYGAVSELWAFIFSYGGIKPGDRVLFAYALGISSTSMILWGIRKSGAIPIDIDVRAGADEVLYFAKLTRAVCLVTTPSLADYMVSIANDSIGVPVSELGIKSLYLCGEPGAGIHEFRKRLEGAFNAKVYDFWSPGGLGFGISCNSQQYYGLHCFAPDYNLYQDDLIEPKSHRPLDVKDGAIGEAVHTSLDRDASPVIRYAYGDVVQVFTKECPGCGFRGKRLKFVGRSDNMLMFKGLKIYPEAIKEVVSSFIPEVTGEIRILLNEPPPKISLPLKIKIEYAFGSESIQLSALETKIKEMLYKRNYINSEIIWVPPNSFKKSSQKTEFFEIIYSSVCD